MAYKALYRRYRPTNFDEVVGQKYIIQTIKNSIANDKIGHAYLFSGSRGIGKTTIARIIAKAVNCKELDHGNPCNKCKVCESINDGSNIDVVEIDAASNNGVDEMRSLLEKVNFLPATLTHKIYIIDEVHMLSISAFNALLKTLEEPPAHVIFILATTEPHKVPATILSRCQRFDFKPLTRLEIIEQLTKIKDLENIQINNEALALIAEISEGGMRDALSIMDQVSAYTEQEITAEDVNNITGRVSDGKVIELFKLINNSQVSDALDIVNDLLDMGKEVSVLVQSMLSLCRDMVLYQNVTPEENAKAIFSNFDFIKLAEETKRNKIFKYVDVLNDVQNKIKFTNTPKIYLEVGIVKMTSLDVSSSHVKVAENVDLSEAYDKIYQLEAQVKNLFAKNEENDFGEFKDFAKSKLEFLEEMISKCAVPPRDLEERIEILEEDPRLENLEKRVQDIISSNSNVQPTLFDNVQPTDSDKYQELSNKLAELENKYNELASRQPQIVQTENKAFEQELESLKNSLSMYVTYDILEEKVNASKEEYIYNTNHEVSNVSVEDFKNLLNSYVTKSDLEQRLANIKVEETNLDDVYKRLEELSTKAEAAKEEIKIPEFVENESEPFELPQDDFFNTVDESYESVSELEKIRENYFTLFNKVVDLQKDIETNKQDVVGAKDSLNELKAQIENLPTSSVTEEQLQELENKILSVKEYALKVGARTTQLEENYKNVKVEQETPKQIIQKRTSPYETAPRVEQKVMEQTIVPQEVQEEPVEEPLKENQVDETAKAYDIRVIENILHQSRDRKNMEDKERINSVWYRLQSLVPQPLASIASTLSDGKVVVNGANYLIIVYSKASICNYLMTANTHYEAKQVLRTTLQKEYDFIALPVNTWHEKSNEYKGQYHMGIKFPSLTPIKNPELKVINVTKENFQTNSSRNYDKAKEMFGQSLIREVK